MKIGIRIFLPMLVVLAWGFSLNFSEIVAQTKEIPRFFFLHIYDAKIAEI